MKSSVEPNALDIFPTIPPSKLNSLLDDSLLRFIPAQSWDSHMHILDPSQYPLCSDAAYKPTTNTLTQALALESSLGLRNIVLVQPSVYGYDNSCLLDALSSIGSRRGRGVVAFDPETISPQVLMAWQRLGVCGVRLNLKSTEKALQPRALKNLLRKYADVARPLGWVLQIYMDMESLPTIEKVITNLGVKVCLDHLACPSLPPPSSRTPGAEDRASSTYSTLHDPYEVPGFSSLINILRAGNTYVKLSAAYRISNDPRMKDVEVIAKELLREVGCSRVVFGTDWPHTRFEGLDVKPFVKACIRWCNGDLKLIDRVFRGNAEDLWGQAA
jgi:predicted TIM-barrel fold metal-dependent hydrolase